jgi:hypothetical protein
MLKAPTRLGHAHPVDLLRTRTSLKSSRRGCLRVDLLARCIGRKLPDTWKLEGNYPYHPGNTKSGWWWLEPWNFMTFHMLGTRIPFDFHIFHRGSKTTNQLQTILDLAISFDAELLGFNPFRQEIWWKALTSLVSFVGSASCGLDPCGSQQILG